MIVKNRDLEDKEGKIIDVDEILRDNYSPKQITVKGKLRYGWKK